MMPHVDSFLPIHSLSSITDLVASLSIISETSDADIVKWKKRALEISAERAAEI